MQTAAERRSEKAKRLLSRSEKWDGECDRRRSIANGMSDMIPFGQPILVGHHSEKASRRAYERIRFNTSKQFEAMDKASDLRGRAESVEKSTSIMSQDSDAVELLRKKIETLEASQIKMKGINKILKSKKLLRSEKIRDIVNDFGLTEIQADKLFEPDFCGRIGFPSFSLTNNNANIRSTKKRLEQLLAMKKLGDKEYEEKGIKIFQNKDAARIQLFFDGKPEEEVRTKLKRRGFRWSPKNSAWQTHYNVSGLRRTKWLLEEL